MQTRTRMGPSSAGTPGRGEVAHALGELRDVLAGATYPLDLPGAGSARREARRLLAQLDDYLIPRADSLDESLLAVVGGSTGAGKSTLVNSLVRAPVSPAGVLRPTTRAPLLVCHPRDGGSFAPELARVHAPLLAPGLALLDAPDIDSVVEGNRALAWRLLDAADLWLFVTTAARYADAVPWQALRTARERGTAIGIVLDRVPPEVRDEIADHFAAMLRAQGLDRAPLFVLPESPLDPYGLLPERTVAPIKLWLDAVAAERVAVARHTLLGAVAAVGTRIGRLSEAADDQVSAITGAISSIETAYEQALAGATESLRAGDLLRGEVWGSLLETARTGELRLALRATSTRDQHRRARGAHQPPPGQRLQAAIATALTDLLIDNHLLIYSQVAAAAPDSARSVVDGAHHLVQAWRGWLRDLVRSEAGMRSRARSYVSASTVLLATIAAVSPAPEDAPPLVQGVLANPRIADLGSRARARFEELATGLFTTSARRATGPLHNTGVDAWLATRLRTAGHHLRLARLASTTELDDVA